MPELGLRYWQAAPRLPGRPRAARGLRRRGGGGRQASNQQQSGQLASLGLGLGLGLPCMQAVLLFHNMLVVNKKPRYAQPYLRSAVLR
jgi:hypothetical protein